MHRSVDMDFITQAQPIARRTPPMSTVLMGIVLTGVIARPARGGKPKRR